MTAGRWKKKRQRRRLRPKCKRAPQKKPRSPDHRSTVKKVRQSPARTRALVMPMDCPGSGHGDLWSGHKWQNDLLEAPLASGQCMRCEADFVLTRRDRKFCTSRCRSRHGQHKARPRAPQRRSADACPNMLPYYLEDKLSAAAIFEECGPYTVAGHQMRRIPRAVGNLNAGALQARREGVPTARFSKRRGPSDIVPRSPQSVCGEVPPPKNSSATFPDQRSAGCRRKANGLNGLHADYKAHQSRLDTVSPIHEEEAVPCCSEKREISDGW